MYCQRLVCIKVATHKGPEGYFCEDHIPRLPPEPTPEPEQDPNYIPLPKPT